MEIIEIPNTSITILTGHLLNSYNHKSKNGMTIIQSAQRLLNGICNWNLLRFIRLARTKSAR